MHKFAMPEAIVDRVLRKRGRAHAFEHFRAAKTALVVVDLQNAFMQPGVAHALCVMASKIVPNVNRLAGSLRSAGGTVVWVRTTATPQSLHDWSVYYELLTPEAQQRRLEALREGSVGHAFWSELDMQDRDLVVTKLRYSAFIQGSSDLEPQLRARGIDTVLITGCVTNTCCEATARDAMMRNFRTVMVSDANAAGNDQEHASSLVAFYLNFGDVQTTDEIISRLSMESARAAASG